MAASLHGRGRLIEAVWIGVLGLGGVGVALGYNPLPRTLNNYFGRGTQPQIFGEPLNQATDNCSLCHSGFNEVSEPYTRWTNSMMAQATRDPVFKACLAIANQDAAFGGETCLRCHAPMGWIEERSEPTDGSALGGQYDAENQAFEFPGDFEGVSCSVCHRMVDPTNAPGAPARDAAILASLNTAPNGIPVNPGTANYVIDPFDYRRGPLNLSTYWGANFVYHYWDQSPFHLSSRLCATCHDVSNPNFTRQPNGSYTLNGYNEPHATQDKYDQFPMERTYSEWSQSLFAAGPVNTGEYPVGSGQPRFGGLAGPSVSSCQDCHMPIVSGTLCGPFLNPPSRPDIPQHNFNGSNSWVLRAVDYLYPQTQTGLTAGSISSALARNSEMLQRASDLELSVVGTSVNARIINMTGHKLPTGYSEGRRMWINVRFLNANNQLIEERGGYNASTAALTTADTKVYEAQMGVDAAMAAVSGLAQGPTFHFAINNTIYLDNRIPPMGFTNAGFASVQSRPVAYAYADGQYWDDTLFAIPPLATSVTATVYHQTTTKEYIEFLRDANVTNTAGQTAYTMWAQFGKSAPVAIDSVTRATNRCAADWDGNGVVEPADIAAFVNAWFSDLTAGTHRADVDLDGIIAPSDVATFVTQWFGALSGPCP